MLKVLKLLRRSNISRWNSDSKSRREVSESKLQMNAATAHDNPCGVLVKSGPLPLLCSDSRLSSGRLVCPT